MWREQAHSCTLCLLILKHRMIYDVHHLQSLHRVFDMRHLLLLVLSFGAALGSVVGCGSSGSSVQAASRRLSASKSVQDFGSVFQGTTQTAAITVTNTSSAATAQVPLVLLEGAGDDLAVHSLCAHPLEPSESCEIEITYSPKALEARTATLVVFDDGVGGVSLDTWTRLGQPSRAARPLDLVIPVQGEGARRDKLSVRESKLDWGILGAALEAKPIHLASVGVDPVKTVFTLSGASDQYTFGSCPEVLAPGENCDLTVRPVPRRGGTLEARVDWESGLSCELRSIGTYESLMAPQLIESPTTESLRAVASSSHAQVVTAGTGGVVLKLGQDNRWSKTVVPTMEDLNAVATYGGDDSTRNGMTFRFLDDERDLVFAGGAGGAILLSRNGGAFAPLSPSQGSAIIRFDVGFNYPAPPALDNLYRPEVFATHADGREERSLALAPPVTRGPAQPAPVTLVAFAPCSLSGRAAGAYVGADGNAYSDASVPLRKIDVPDAQSLHGVDCASSVRGTSLVLVGANGIVVSSVDGITWNREPSDTMATLRAVASDANGDRVAVGESGTIVYSLDGGPWHAQASPTKKTLNAVFIYGVTWFAVGDEGTVVRLSRPNN